MKIAIFTNNYLPNPYGVTVSVETFRSELEKRGHAVYVFAPDWPGYHDDNQKVFRYPSLDIKVRFRFPLAIPFSRKMRRILEALELDVIHAQHPNLLGWAARRWARKKKIPLVFTWHTLYDHYTNFVPFLPKELVTKYIIKQAANYANSADAVIAPTASIISILKRWGVRKEIIPIATGIREEEFSGADGKSVRQKYAIGAEETVLILVSRLTEEKNIRFVFRSLESILQSDKKVKFLVAGDGYLVPELEKFCRGKNISDQVIFAGVVAHDELKNYYAAADIFVYGSKSETQGIIPLEAMYSGLPIVAVNSTGISSLMLDKANGFLVKEDEREFSQAVKKLIDDPDLCKRFGEASSKIARDNFTSGVCAEKLLELYGRVIGENADK